MTDLRCDVCDSSVKWMFLASRRMLLCQACWTVEDEMCGVFVKRLMAFERAKLLDEAQKVRVTLRRFFGPMDKGGKA